MDFNLIDFVMKVIEEINLFDCESIECMKKVIRKVIDFYYLKMYEEVEEIYVGSVWFLYVYFIMEENMLFKIVVVIRNGEIDLDIEGVYEGYVVREY